MDAADSIRDVPDSLIEPMDRATSAEVEEELKDFSPLDSLPAELLIKIFGFFGYHDIYGGINSVSRRFHKIVQANRFPLCPVNVRITQDTGCGYSLLVHKLDVNSEETGEFFVSKIVSRNRAHAGFGNEEAISDWRTEAHKRLQFIQECYDINSVDISKLYFLHIPLEWLSRVNFKIKTLIVHQEAECNDKETELLASLGLTSLVFAKQDTERMFGNRLLKSSIWTQKWVDELETVFIHNLIESSRLTLLHCPKSMIFPGDFNPCQLFSLFEEWHTGSRKIKYLEFPTRHCDAISQICLRLKVDNLNGDDSGNWATVMNVAGEMLQFLRWGLDNINPSVFLYCLSQ